MLDEQFVLNTGSTRTGKRELNFSRPRRRKGPKGSRTQRLNRKAKAVTQDKVISNMVMSVTRENGISLLSTRRVNLKRRLVVEVAIMVIPLALSVGRSIQESVNWGQTSVSFVARKATLPKTVIPILRIKVVRTNKEHKISQKFPGINSMRFKP